MRVIHPRLCSKSLGILLLLLFTRAAGDCLASYQGLLWRGLKKTQTYSFFFFPRPSEEVNSYFSGLLPSRYYAAFSAQDLAKFKEALWVTVVVVASVCVVRMYST